MLPRRRLMRVNSGSARLRLASTILVLLLMTACGTRVEGDSPYAVGAGPSVQGNGPSASGAATTLAVASGQGSTGSASSTGGVASATSGSGGGLAGEAPDAATPATGEPILLGAVGTRSGIIGASLERAWRGLDVWQAWVNANGGIGGRPVEVVVADDGADPARHASAVRQLIVERGVQAFVGSVAPLTFSAGVPILEEFGIPSLGGDSADAGWFSSPMAFPIGGTTLSRAIPMATWAIGNLAERRVAVYYVNEADAPARIARAFEDEWRRLGGEVVVSAGVSIAQPDFTAEVLQASAARADVVYLAVDPAACTRFFDAAARQRYQPQFLTSACTLENALENRDLLAGRLAVASHFRPVGAGDLPAQREILDAISRFDPELVPDDGFLFTWLSGKLLQASGGATTETIVAALHSLAAEDLGGMVSPQSYPPGPHAESSCGVISRYEGGDALVLATPEFLC